MARLDRTKDSLIDYSEIPPLGREFLKKATVPWPPAKKQLTIRLDTDVLAWLRAAGRGYQTRINRRQQIENVLDADPHPANARSASACLFDYRLPEPAERRLPV